MGTTALAHRADWVDLSDVLPVVDPFALKIPKTELTKTQWLAIRRTGIGSSDVATVLGENPYKTPFALYQRRSAKWRHHDLL